MLYKFLAWIVTTPTAIVGSYAIGQATSPPITSESYVTIGSVFGVFGFVCLVVWRLSAANVRLDAVEKREEKHEEVHKENDLKQAAIEQHMQANHELLLDIKAAQAAAAKAATDKATELATTTAAKATALAVLEAMKSKQGNADL